MSKMTGKKTENTIQAMHKEKAMSLLNNIDYLEYIKKFEELSLFGERRERIAREKEELIKKLPKEDATITPSSPFHETVKRWKELDKEESDLDLQRLVTRNAILNKYSIPYIYCIDELNDIVKGHDRFLFDESNIVDLVRLREPKYKPIPRQQLTKEDLDYCPTHSEIIDDGYLDENGCLHFKIKPTAQRYLIHHLLDVLLDLYPFEAPPKGGNREKRSRFRIDSPDRLAEGLEIIQEVSKGKSLLRIAKERCGINENPAYNATVKAAYENDRRLLNKAKRHSKQ